MMIKTRTEIMNSFFLKNFIIAIGFEELMFGSLCKFSSVFSGLSNESTVISKRSASFCKDVMSGIFCSRSYLHSVEGVTDKQSARSR